MTIRPSYTVVEIDYTNEKRFLEITNKDPLNYHFFRLDWFEERKVSRFYLAMEKGRIGGLMVVYNGKTAQIKGSAKAVDALLETIDPKVGQLSVPYEHRRLLLKRFAPKFRSEMDLLYLVKGQERLHIVHKPVGLTPKDAKAVSALLLRADPRMWKNFSPDAVKRSMRTNIWIGIKDHGRLAAIGNARSTKLNGHIYTIATAKEYRGQGYATSIVSALVQALLKCSKDLLIYVFRTNGPANKVYRKVGFRTYKRMMYLDGKKLRKKVLKN
jgi:ribosomal protein S18 acetylase RimI-like enzyme